MAPSTPSVPSLLHGLPRTTRCPPSRLRPRPTIAGAPAPNTRRAGPRRFGPVCQDTGIGPIDGQRDPNGPSTRAHPSRAAVSPLPLRQDYATAHSVDINAVCDNGSETPHTGPDAAGGARSRLRGAVAWGVRCSEWQEKLTVKSPIAPCGAPFSGPWPGHRRAHWWSVVSPWRALRRWSPRRERVPLTSWSS